MNNFKDDLIIQPITFFESKGLFLVALFPTILYGLTAVLCGEEKNTNRVRVVHECTICKGVGHENCPYVQEAIKYYMAHVQKKFPSYSITLRKVIPDPRWYQFTKEEKAELIKKVKDGAKPVTQHS